MPEGLSVLTLTCPYGKSQGMREPTPLQVSARLEVSAELERAAMVLSEPVGGNSCCSLEVAVDMIRRQRQTRTARYAPVHRDQSRGLAFLVIVREKRTLRRNR